MAYGRIVKMKEAGAEALASTVKYAGDDRKRTCADVFACPSLSGRYFVSAVLFNRRVRGRTRDSCYFYHLIFYLDDSWPSGLHERQRYERSLFDFLGWWGFQYIDRGYAVCGAVHTNTRKPHVHLLVDTCNWLKDQPAKNCFQEVSRIKGEINVFLEAAGIPERIESDFTEMTEDELLVDENEIPEGETARCSGAAKIYGNYCSRPDRAGGTGYTESCVNYGMPYLFSSVPYNAGAALNRYSAIPYSTGSVSYGCNPCAEWNQNHEVGMQGYILQSALPAYESQFEPANEPAQNVFQEQKVMCTKVPPEVKALYPTKEQYGDAKRKGLI